MTPIFSKGIFALPLFVFAAQVFAQGSIVEDCNLGERYYTIAQNRIAENTERSLNQAVDLLLRASSVCNRFEYYLELGKFWMKSANSINRKLAVDVFVNAYDVAETAQQQAAALRYYAELLVDSDPQNALELIAEARQLDPTNQEVITIEKAITVQVLNYREENNQRRGTELSFRSLPTVEEGRSEILNMYPWPPEDPSWQIRIDQEFKSPLNHEMSLMEVENTLSVALREASLTYSDTGLYSAPNGFVIVTRIEAIDSEGVPLEGQDRFRLPNEDRDLDLIEYIRSLFIAPEGYYRVIAFIISDRFFSTNPDALAPVVAISRLRRGATQLPPIYRNMKYTESHRIDAPYL